MALPGFFRKVLSHLGLKREEDERRSSGESEHRRGAEQQPGFRTRVPCSEGPVVSQCNYGNCGVQGLKWYTDMLRADCDGDVAQEFLHESTYVGQDNKERAKLRPQLWTVPVKPKGPLCAVDGNLHQYVELGGEVYWV